MVKVYEFTKCDIQTGEDVKALCKCTADGIQIMGGVKILETEEEVDESALDSDGRYYPKAQSEKPPPA